MKLLIVDDSRLIRNQVEDMIRLHFPELEIRANEDGQQALITIRQWRPQIVLLDIVMPLVTGIEVLTQLGDLIASGEIKVLMFSSVGDSVTLKQCFELGASDFISKPLDEIEALARMGNAVKSIGFIQEMQHLKEELVECNKLLSIRESVIEQLKKELMTLRLRNADMKGHEE